MPRTALAPLVTGIEDSAMRLIPRGQRGTGVCSRGYSRWCDADVATTPALRHCVATHIHDLVAVAIGATRDGTEIAKARGVRAARLAAIKADVMTRTGERDLTLAAVAARHRISLRSVQVLFESEGVTFSQFVLEQRLVRANRLPATRELPACPISAIALEAGFGDLSYFNRRFRRQHGCTPSNARGGHGWSSPWRRA